MNWTQAMRCATTGFSSILAIAIGSFSSAFAAPVPKPAPLSKDEAEKKFYGYWAEAKLLQAGKGAAGGGYRGWKFASDRIDEWCLFGDLDPSGSTGWWITLDPTKNPMHFDWHRQNENKGELVTPGIFKFDGDKLILITPGFKGCFQPVRKDGNYKGRPTEFSSTIENDYVMRVLKPCKDLQTEFPKGFFED
jgi:uncharacterized protein (TIGR03067 family)